MIIKKIISSFFEENIYLITDKKSDESIIIDPGNSNELVKYINDNKLKPIAIFNTHSHPDHIVFAYNLQEKYNIPFKMHLGEKSIISHVPDLAQMIGLTNFSLPKNISYFSESKINIGPFTIDIIHTPGHSPGSVCFQIENNLFTGDTIFAGSIGRIDLPGGSQKDMNNSIELLKKLPENIKIFPGHGPNTTIEKEIKENPYFQFGI